MILGVDRSHHNKKIALASLVEKQIGFIMLKGTEALKKPDSTFDAAWQEIKAIPGNLSGELMKRGAYCFFDGRFDGVAQAKNYLSLKIDFHSPGCLCPWVDVEDLVGYNAAGEVDEAESARLNKWVADNWQVVLQRLIDFLNYIKQETGRDCGIYTYNGYMKEYFHEHRFADNPMWLSSLQKTCPLRYDKGSYPDFWQFTYNWNDTDMDGNYFMGDAQQLNKLANIA